MGSELLGNPSAQAHKVGFSFQRKSGEVRINRHFQGFTKSLHLQMRQVGVVQKPSASQCQPSKCNWEKADIEGPKGTASPGLGPGLQTLPGELVRVVATMSLWLPALLSCKQDKLFTTFSHFAKYRRKVAR